MKKFLKKSAFILAVVASLSLCGCSGDAGNSSPVSSDNNQSSSEVSSTPESSAPESSDSESTGGTESSTPAPESSTGTPGNKTGNGLLADLTGTFTDVSSVFECSDGWTNGSMFNCTWRKSNVDFSDGSMKLKIDLDAGGLGKIPYSGGEFRSKDFYGYGMYEVEMKPIKNDGVVSSFFTYTGPTDNNPWDEIDIEFLGKDTTVVQFNYYTNGRGGHEHIHELGFDASEDFHIYAFDWQPDKITWYVDGEEVYSAEKNLPSTPGKIMMNVWPGTGVDGWLNAYDGTTPLTAEYKSVDFRE